MRTLLTCLTLAVLFSCRPTYLFPGEPTITSGFSPSYEKKIVSGVPILVVRDDALTDINLEVRYKVGGAHDPKGKEGLAHAVEHLVFEVPVSDDENAPTFGEALGRISTGWNAGTTLDRTSYETRLPPHLLQEALALELGKIDRGCQGLSEEDFLRERDVVRNERRQRDLGATGQLLEALREFAYAEGHPYRNSVIGSDRSITSLTLQDVCEFMMEHYRRDNMIVVVSGPVRPQVVFEIGEELLDGEGASVWAEALTPRPALEEAQDRTVELPIESHYLFAFWPMAPVGTQKHRLQTQVVAALSVEIEDLGEDESWLVSADAMLQGGKAAPYLMVAVEIDSRESVAAAKSLVDKAVKSLIDKKGEYEHGNLQLSSLLQRYENESLRPSIFADYLQFDKRRGSLNRDLQELKSVDKGELTLISELLLSKPPRYLVTVPTKEEYKPDKESGYVFEPGSLPQSAPLDLNEELIAEVGSDLPIPSHLGKEQAWRRYQMSNGLSLILAPDHRIPIVHATMLIPTGAAMASDRLRGISKLLPGIDDYDVTTFDFSHLSEEVHILMAVLASQFKSKKSIIDAKKRAKLTELLSTPESLAAEKFARDLRVALYGANHPYTRTDYDHESLARFDDAAIRRWASRSRSVRGATLIITGRFDPSYVHQLAMYFFGQEAHHRPAGVRYPATPTHAATLTLVDDSSDTLSIALAFRGGIGVDTQQPARELLALILGHRLEALREELTEIARRHIQQAQRDAQDS